MSRIVLFLLFLVVGGKSFSQDYIVQEIRKVCPEANVSFVLRDLETGEKDYSYNSEKLLIPASLMKLLTTSSSLDEYYGKKKFYTSIGYRGKIKKGILYGSLVIKASGDASWNSKYFPKNDVFKLIENILKKKKIKRITGGVIIDEGGVDYSLNGKWLWEDISNYFGASLHGINIFDNTYKLFLHSGKPGSLTNLIKIEPNIENLTFENKVISSRVIKDDAWIFGGPTSSKRIIKGSIPMYRKSFIVKGSIQHPGGVFFKTLISRLYKSGIICTDSLEYLKNVRMKDLGKVYWPNLSELVYNINQHSVNIFSESLSKKVGDLKQFFKGKGLNVDKLQIIDGCGMSHFNMLTGDFISSLLVYINKQKYSKVFISSLPEIGKEGTLKYFGLNSKLIGNLRAKTGSMHSVRCFAGYVKVSGKWKAFSFMANNYSCKTKDINSMFIRILETFF